MPDLNKEVQLYRDIMKLIYKWNDEQRPSVRASNWHPYPCREGYIETCKALRYNALDVLAAVTNTAETFDFLPEHESERKPLLKTKEGLHYQAKKQTTQDCDYPDHYPDGPHQDPELEDEPNTKEQPDVW